MLISPLYTIYSGKNECCKGVESLPPYGEKKGRMHRTAAAELSGNKGYAKWSHFWFCV